MRRLRGGGSGADADQDRRAAGGGGRPSCNATTVAARRRPWIKERVLHGGDGAAATDRGTIFALDSAAR